LILRTKKQKQSPELPSSFDYFSNHLFIFFYTARISKETDNNCNNKREKERNGLKERTQSLTFRFLCSILILLLLKLENKDQVGGCLIGSQHALIFCYWL